MVNNNNPLVQILRLVDEVYEVEEPKPMSRGRPRTYQDIVILKVFIVMVIKRIKTFKGLHRYLQQNPMRVSLLAFPENIGKAPQIFFPPRSGNRFGPWAGR